MEIAGPTLNGLRYVGSLALLGARSLFHSGRSLSRKAPARRTRYDSHDEPVSERDITAVVGAMDRDVEAGLREMVAGLDQYFSGLSPVGGAR